MRQRQRGLLRYVLGAVVGSVFVSAALAAPPETYAGKPVRAEQWTISGGSTETFYATDDGFIPMSTDRVTINFMGPKIKKPKNGQTPSYVWGISLAFAGQAMPQRVTMEDVTGPEAATLIVEDDVRPPVLMMVGDEGLSATQDVDWTAQSSEPCDIVRGNACSAWMFFGDTYYMRLRFTIEYRDGSRETIYQGIKLETAGLPAKLGLGE